MATHQYSSLTMHMFPLKFQVWLKTLLDHILQKIYIIVIVVIDILLLLSIIIHLLSFILGVCLMHISHFIIAWTIDS